MFVSCIGAGRVRETKPFLCSSRHELHAYVAPGNRLVIESASSQVLVADANDLAVTAAEDAAIDIEASSNAIDEIVSSEIVDNSIKSLPAIVATVAVVALASIAILLARRAVRRRRHPILAPVVEDFKDLEFDFDRILAEIKQKQKKSPAVTKARTTKTAVKKPNQGKR